MWGRRTKRYARCCSLCLLVGGLLACGEDPAPPPVIEACTAAAERLEECGLAAQACATEQERCFARCQAHMDCAALEDPNSDPGAVACWFYCAPRFDCRDGQQILAQWVCDDVIDCADESDEVSSACE